MKILSLFDGLSCGRIALERAGINVEKYYASEIDKNAIKVSQDNWKDIIQLGDINNWKQWDIDWSNIDLLIGGSPCQGFSFAGKQLNFNDERSKLFFTYVDILSYIKFLNPNVKFLLENVKMKKEYQDIISQYLGVEPININSSLVSAQSRNRLYWCNWKIEQPKDKGILLKDILENIDFEDKVIFHKDTYLDKLNNTNNIIFASQLTNSKKFGNAISLNGKAFTLRASTPNGIGIKLNKKLLYRKFSPIEVERLQNVPDNYTKCISISQRYKSIGNGWTVDVIAHIFKELLNNKE